MKLKDWLPTDNCYGWIDSDHNIYFIENIYEHANFFKTRPEFAQEYQAYRDDLENNQEIINDHLDSLDDDEHPAMHCFEGMDDESRQELYYKVHQQGWIRFGVYIQKKRVGQPKTLIEAHGITKHLDIVKPYIMSLTKRLSNSTITFFHIKGTSYGYMQYKAEKVK